jgi:hypothetical protein
MRSGLKGIEGERKTFTGVFARFGKKDRYRPKKVGDEWVTFDVTVLLVDARDGDGNVVTDHLSTTRRGLRVSGTCRRGTRSGSMPGSDPTSRAMSTTGSTSTSGRLIISSPTRRRLPGPGTGDGSA